MGLGTCYFSDGYLRETMVGRGSDPKASAVLWSLYPNPSKLKLAVEHQAVGN